jgi:hypothetical protein
VQAAKAASNGQYEEGTHQSKFDRSDDPALAAALVENPGKRPRFQSVTGSNED